MSEEFVICRPSEFHGRIHRNLSPWHKELPSLEVFVVMGDVAVCVSPADVGAVKTLIDSATTELGGGQPARTEEGGGEREGDVEEKARPETEGENDGVLLHYSLHVQFVLWGYLPLLSPFREASSCPFTRHYHCCGAR